MPRTSHYASPTSAFVFLAAPNGPAWRSPQVGAISAAVARWSLEPETPILLSMPTGSGKTGVETALPYLARAHRVLVVVPSTELRRQIASAFENEDVLRNIGAVTTSLHPIVEEVKGRSIDWTLLESSDVVVALPNSISPLLLSSEYSPPEDFFDLIIVDEAHHAPAATWRAILEHFPKARKALLTATPRRADGKPLPGSHAFHYPLRLAMAEGIYQKIVPRILAIGSDTTVEFKDGVIADDVVAVAQEDDHRTSAILIRSGSIARASRLKSIYAHRGLNVEILHSRVSDDERKRIVDSWRDGSVRAVITVDMLAEGFDLPRLRIVGYHDKHKSEAATMQFIGRLARSSTEFPQTSVLVTARDQDLYPALQGALRRLYEEDADWTELLPQIIDDEVASRRLDEEYLEAFDDAPSAVSLSALNPLARAIIYEGDAAGSYEPSFANNGVPEEVKVGAIFQGQTVVYVGLNEHATQLVLLTSRLDTPRWYQNDEGLTRPVFDLHVLSWKRAAQLNRRNLLLVNTQDTRMANALVKLLDPSAVLRNGNPAFLQDAFDSVERLSVSSVGVRNTYAAVPGTPAYAMFAGSGIEGGLRDSDTHSRALGHAMAQMRGPAGDTFTGGLAVTKSKYWETRYMSLRRYEAFVSDLVARYWFPRTTPTGPLLPNVARGIRTEFFPTGTRVVAVELNPVVFAQGWHLEDGRSLASMDVEIDQDRPLSAGTIPLRLYDPAEPSVAVWTGDQDTFGRFTTVAELSGLSRGAGLRQSIADLFTVSPPTIYFLDGQTVFGSMTFMPVTTGSALPDFDFVALDWTGVDIQKESQSVGRSDTIHDKVETLLSLRSVPEGTKRWVLRNDGSGEIADHLVIEMPASGRPRLELWHSKFAASATAAVRVTDMEVVTQQAAKSRRHLTDRDFWNRVGRRLSGGEAPTMHLVAGDRADLLALCGLIDDRQDESLTARPPTLESEIVIVQPGLSISALKLRLSAGDQSAGQVREFLTFVANAVDGQASVRLLCSP